MLTARLPFEANSRAESLELMDSCMFAKPSHMSELAVDLLERLLEPNPSLRLGIDAILDHPFMLKKKKKRSKRTKKLSKKTKKRNNLPEPAEKVATTHIPHRATR